MLTRGAAAIARDDVHRVWLTLFLLLVLLVASTRLQAPAAAQAPDPLGAEGCAAEQWVRSWAAAPSDAVTDTANPGRQLGFQTLRMVVRPYLEGSTARISLSNRLSQSDAPLGTVTIAQREDGADAVPGTLQEVTFEGSSGVVIPAGGEVVSDPVDIEVRSGEDLLVSIHVPQPIFTPTQHFITNQTNYVTPNGTPDMATSEDGSAYVLTTQVLLSQGWYFLNGIDVLASGEEAAVVGFGDSITDGYQGTGLPLNESPEGLDANARYPDFLSQRLRAAGRSLVAVNAGISGNQLLSPSETGLPFGPRGLDRLPPDALAIPGVTDVISLIGINDLGFDEDLTPAELIAGYEQQIAQVRAAGLFAHVGTLTPALSDSPIPQQGAHGTEQTNDRREAVNQWIRVSGAADSVIDFDAAVRDPDDPRRLAEQFDSSDDLHPSTLGYERMAEFVPLSALRGPDCALERPAVGQLSPTDEPIEAGVAVSRRTFADGSATRVVIGRADLFADNLGGAALAGADGPLLLVPGGPDQALPDLVADEIARVLGPAGTACPDAEVFVLGGPQAVGDGIVDGLARGDGCVGRIAGPSRVETALAVADQVRGDGRVVLATAEDWVDAVVVGAWAARAQVPVIITPSAQLHPAVAAWLSATDVTDIIVVGGTRAVSEAVTDALRAIAQTRRVDGPDRDGTAVAILNQLWQPDDLAEVTVVNGHVADGWVYALTAAPHAARDDAPQLLVRSDGVPNVTCEALAARTPSELSTAGGALRVFPAIQDEAVEAAAGRASCASG